MMEGCGRGWEVERCILNRTNTLMLVATGTPVTDEAVVKARDYLLDRQLEDGSWLVESHTHKVQNTSTMVILRRKIISSRLQRQPGRLPPWLERYRRSLKVGTDRHATRSAPSFAYDPHGGPDQKGAWCIESVTKKGCKAVGSPGSRSKGVSTIVFTLCENDWRRFGASLRSSENPLAGCTRQKAVHAELSLFRIRGTPLPAEPEYPVDGSMDEKGWTELSGLTWPPQRCRGLIELEFRWARKARLEWSSISWS